MVWKPGLALLLAAGSAAAQPARLEHLGGRAVIHLAGRSDLAMASQAEALLTRAPGALVVMQGPGGDLHAGMLIGIAIRAAGADTVVPPGATCASACAYAWLGGRDRSLAAGARLGFHAVSERSAQGRVVSSSGNAELGAYLNALDIPLGAIRRFTTPQPDAVEWLGAAAMTALGVPARQVGAPAAPRPASPPPIPVPVAPAAPVTGDSASRWQGAFTCGRDVVAARMLLWRDGPRLAAAFEFGPSERSPLVEPGSVQLAGGWDGEGVLRLLPTGVAQLPPGHAPSAMLFRQEGGALAGAFLRPGPCGAIRLLRE